MKQRSLKLRLSVIFFGQFFIAGTFIPIMALYLRESLGFSGVQVGAVIAMSSVSAFVAPLVSSFIADRVLKTERLYGLSHIIGSLLMVTLSFQRDFKAVLFMYLAYMLIYGPTVALANSFVFHYLPDAKKSFGGIRLWGTVGWVSVAWLFGKLYLYAGGSADRLGHALLLAAAAGFLLGIYALGAFPEVRERQVRRVSIIPRESLAVMKQPGLLLFAVLALCISFVDKYYYFGSAIYLKELGFRGDLIMPVMSIGQTAEIGALALLGFLLVRFSFRTVFMLGALMEVLRFGLFVLVPTPAGAVAGIVFHGPAFAFFFAAAFIYLDSHCSPEARSGVHQMFAIIETGFGNLLGNMIAGGMLQQAQDSAAGRAINFHLFWGLPLLVSLAVFLFLAGAGLFRTGFAADSAGKHNPQLPGNIV